MYAVMMFNWIGLCGQVDQKEISKIIFRHNSFEIGRLFLVVLV